MSITGTLIIQIIVFLLLAAFTMKYVWPPIAKALDERAQKVAEGLAAADKAKADLAEATQRVEKELADTRAENAQKLADAERRVQLLIDEAKARAEEEGRRIISAARAEAEHQSFRVRDELREKVAMLAVKGAEQILKREINPQAHSEILSRLKTEL